MRNVLHIRSSGGILGAENVIFEIARNSYKFGYSVIVGAIQNVNDPYPEFLKVLESEGLPTVVFKCFNQFDLRCAWNIKKFITNNKIDVLHTHGYKEDFFAILARLKLPKIATNHLWKTRSLKGKLYCYIDSKILNNFNYIIGVSDEIVSDMKKKKIENVLKIDNGVDVNKFYLQSKSKELCNEFNLQKDTIIIGMISSLTEIKGHKYAIQAFHNLLEKKKNIKLLITGEGKFGSDLIKMVTELNISDNVIFAGKRTEIPEILSTIDIFLLTSLSEGLPIALLEAMAAKKAVISTSVGGIPSCIQNGENGILVKIKDVDEITNAINELCESPSRRKTLGENAYKTICEKYSSEYMTKQYCLIYDKLLKITV